MVSDEIKKRLKKAAGQTMGSISQSLPVIAGVIILVSTAIANIPKEWYLKLFRESLIDPLIGAASGSIAAGNPLTSYIIGGELLNNGVSLTAVTAFIISWVTVGIIQLPAESTILGKRFAYTRNIIGFFAAILIAIITAAIISIA